MRIGVCEGPVLPQSITDLSTYIHLNPNISSLPGKKLRLASTHVMLEDSTDNVALANSKKYSR